MRILHIVNRLSEGGVESFLLQLLPKLQQNGLKVELLVLDKYATSLASIFAEKGIKVYVSHYGSVYNPMQIFAIRKYLSAFDVVHVHLWPAQLYVSIAKTIINTKAKLITTEHCNFNKRRAYSFYRPIEQWMYRKYDAIVGCGVTSRNNLTEWIGESEQIISIPNGINIQKFKNIQGYSKDVLGLPSNAYIVVMVARFFKQKDHATLIRALLHLPENVYVLFVGSGSTMPQVIEYMASGKPVIASDVDGMSELIADKKMLFPVGNSLELADRILMLMDNHKYAEAKASENRESAQNYSIEAMVSHYMEIYRKIVE